MALEDLPRARRLAETIDDPLIRAYALGQMARSLAAVDKAAGDRPARRRIQPARETSGRPAGSIHQRACGRRAASGRRGGRARRGCKSRSGGRSRCERPCSTSAARARAGDPTAELAMNIARYDRTAAAAVLARAIASFRRPMSIRYRQGFIAIGTGGHRPCPAGLAGRVTA